MKYITPVDFPVIPSNLLDSVDDIVNQYSRIPFVDVTKKTFSIDEDAVPWDFKRYELNPDLNNWLKSNIPFALHGQYQIIRTDMPIHKDRTIFAYNYLISAGGSNVVTNMHDDNRDIVESICMPEFKWYRLNTLRFHSVTGVEPNQPRIAISLRMLHKPVA